MDWLRESEEKIWRLKRHVIWIKEGDKNTNFFHNYAKHMKNINSIWEIKNSRGEMISSFEDIATGAKTNSHRFSRTLLDARLNISLN